MMCLKSLALTVSFDIAEHVNRPGDLSDLREQDSERDLSSQQNNKGGYI
jgi:hypothetical protein